MASPAVIVVAASETPRGGGLLVSERKPEEVTLNIRVTSHATLNVSLLGKTATENKQVFL